MPRNSCNALAALPAVLAGALGLALGACAMPSAHYYADAGHSDAYYAEIRAHLAQPTTIRVDVQVQSHGRVDAAMGRAAYDDAVHVLESLGGFTVTGDPQAASVLSIEIDGNREALDRTSDRILLSDALNGASTDALITDRFAFHLSYRTAAGPLRVGGYHHAVLSTIGKPATPGDRGPYADWNAAFGAAIEDVVLDFLKQVQDSASNPAPLVFMQ